MGQAPRGISGYLYGNGRDGSSECVDCFTALLCMSTELKRRGQCSFIHRPHPEAILTFIACTFFVHGYTKNVHLWARFAYRILDDMDVQNMYIHRQKTIVGTLASMVYSCHGKPNRKSPHGNYPRGLHNQLKLNINFIAYEVYV